MRSQPSFCASSRASRFVNRFNPEFYTGYLAWGTIIFVLVLGTSRVVAARDLSTAAAHATTATVSNLGFLGPPLMLAFFGERGAGPLAMAILAEVMVLLSVGSVLMGANGGPKRGIGSLILRGTMFGQTPCGIAA